MGAGVTDFGGVYRDRSGRPDNDGNVDDFAGGLMDETAIQIARALEHIRRLLGKLGTFTRGPVAELVGKLGQSPACGCGLVVGAPTLAEAAVEDAAGKCKADGGGDQEVGEEAEHVRGQGSGVRGQGSGVGGQGSGIRGQGSGVRGQESGVRSQRRGGGRRIFGRNFAVS